jgi:nucleoside-triphosphatase
MDFPDRITNFFITGHPRCGKTTLVKRICQDSSFASKFGGFITEEKTKNDVRIGFEISTLPFKKKGILAKKNLSSPYRVGSYGIIIEALEGLACPAIRDILGTDSIVVIDEIGKMELFSTPFRNVVLEALDSPQKVLATIMQKKNEFADKIKSREDVQLWTLNTDNFFSVLQEVKHRLF